MRTHFSPLSAGKVHSVKKKNGFHTRSHFPPLCTYTHRALAACSQWQENFVDDWFRHNVYTFPSWRWGALCKLSGCMTDIELWSALHSRFHLLAKLYQKPCHKTFSQSLSVSLFPYFNLDAILNGNFYQVEFFDNNG